MIVPRLKGGLGNQLFQIAAAYSHALKVGDDFAINYNLPHYLGQGKKCNTYKDNIFSNIKTTDIIPESFYSETNFSYSEIPQQKNLLLDGYFQSEKYFINYKDKINNLFDFSSIKIKQKFIDIENKIVLHVRRGDYLENSDIHPSIPLEYYKNCLNELNISNPNVLIVTDDIVSVSKEFTDLNYTHVNGKSELEDFCYIMNADYIIGCNSSFSWWASYLSNSKKIIFPKTWFGPDGPPDSSDIYPTKFIVR